MTAIQDPSSPARLAPRLPLCLLVGLLALVVALPGCRGCSQKKTPEEIAREKAEEERKKKEEEEKKRPIEMSAVMTRPHEPMPQRALYRLGQSFYKPGHWTSATLRAKANLFDVVGDLETEMLDSRSRPLKLETMPYTLATSRAVALPKKQEKYFETQFFVPRTEGRPQVAVRLQGRKPTRRLHEDGHPLEPLRSYQHYFVVLATAPGDYRFLQMLDSFKYPRELEYDASGRDYYRVRLVEADRQTALPSHALYWTSIAYVLLGDFQSDWLRRAQQQALLDWIHWGGQLIVSGPEGLEPLRHTLLAPYLPATRKGARQLKSGQFQQLSAHWTKARGGHRRPLAPVQPWSGVQLEKHPAARAVPGTGDLLVERRVGRGRIVVSAFRLSERELVEWPGCDAMFNACLLRRPARRFFENQEGILQVGWTDKHNQFDPRVLSQVRYFARDPGAGAELDFFRAPDENLGMGMYGQPVSAQEGTDVTSWNDSSAVASVARENLSAAAAIEIPDRWFVVWVVAGYLLVLVPLNWLVCRLIGRVELAWVTAPVIAVVWTGLVIRMARLDIGFARSQTAIGVVELNGDYPRAHVTRYLALYTSLSTPYELSSDDAGALMLPLAKSGGSEAGRFGIDRLTFRYGKGAQLLGLSVRSNSTGFAHSEQMVDLGGAIQMTPVPGGPAKVANQTWLTLHDAVILHKQQADTVAVAWLGTLQPGQEARVEYIPSGDQSTSPRTGKTMAAAQHLPEGLDIAQILQLAEAPDNLELGERRLVAWSADPIPGLAVKPRAPQSQNVSLILAHLDFGFGSDPQWDSNAREDIAPQPKSISARATDDAASSDPLPPAKP